MGIQSKNWSLVLINGFNQHLQKGVLQFNTSPVEDPKLSLVSQLYLNLCFLILTLSFVLGFDRLFTLTFSTVVYKIFIFLYFYLIYTTPTYQSHCVSFYRRFVPINYGFLQFIFLSEGKQCYTRLVQMNANIYHYELKNIISS